MLIRLSEKLRELRIARGFKQEQVAKLIRVDKRTISAYENGTRRPQLETIISFANLFHVSTDYLLGRTNDEIRELNELSREEIDAVLALVKAIKKV